MVQGAKNVPCTDCGERYASYVMDFDHVIGVKSFGIGTRLGIHSDTSLIAEIAKCEVVCANCHRERTFRRMISSRE